MPRGERHDPAIKARARLFVERSLFPLAEIERETGVVQTTIRSWAHREGWKRPLPEREQLPLTPPRLAAMARLFAAGGHARDIGELTGHCESRVHQVAREHGWERAPALDEPSSDPAAAPRPEIAEIEAALRSGTLTRRELDAEWRRAAAIATADLLSGRNPRAGAIVLHLAKIRRANNEFADDRADDDDNGVQRDGRSLAELRDEFYRHLVRIRAERGLDGDPFEPDGA